MKWNDDDDDDDDDFQVKDGMVTILRMELRWIQARTQFHRRSA